MGQVPEPTVPWSIVLKLLGAVCTTLIGAIVVLFWLLIKSYNRRLKEHKQAHRLLGNDDEDD